MTIRLMTIDDYDDVYALWASLPGIGLHGYEDSHEGMDYYLRRNPASCFVAESGGEIVGAVLCGNDGRRGYINHLAVAQQHQSKGIGKALLNACLAAMREEKITKCAIAVFRNNDAGNAFWDSMGITRREEVVHCTLSTEEKS
ncbi:MAG: GNAT family N-acetyltransferase [Oscillospiraceae bacterium]|nr:GNAT family N-acetyltransferase [Oscillospiraceae bacterium]